MKKEISYTDDEKLLFNNQIVHPKYSAKNSSRLYNKIIKKILSDKILKKKLMIGKYNILSIALEDFFWQYCFQFTKYRKFINKKGIDLNVKIYSKKNYFNIDGYGRVKNYLNGNINLLNYIKFLIKNFYFYLWIFFNMPFNRGKIWNDRKFKKDFRYVGLKKNKSDSIILPYSIQSFRKKRLTIQDAVIDDAIGKTKNYKKWMFAIKILKPRKIITTDNLYDNFSILLAAKLTKTKCEAICHSPTIRHHKNIFGSKFIKKNQILKFDKLYVYHKIFKKFILKYGYFYKSNEIKVTKWPNTNKYNYRLKKTNKNIYILYPFEHFSNFKKINEFLAFFKMKNHKIIIKTRPDMKNYDHFDKRLDIEFVNDFTKEHFLNCFCVIGSTTGLLFNCAQNFLPVVYIDDNGYDHFSGLDTPTNWMICKKINNDFYQRIKNFSTSSIFKLR